jgi:hypothetical protein
MPVTTQRSEKMYLGDGVYADFDGFGITLHTERDGGTHWIYFEPEVLAALFAYVERLKSRRAPEGR